MATIRAVVNQEKSNAIVADVGSPKLRDDYLIVKVKAVALNPTDWKHLEFLAVKGNRMGCGMCCSTNMPSSASNLALTPF
jgi:NADPH:quinone reductase-like Zn-dependent oxidoreductase